ncbi:MAG: hypothetical protein ACK4P1_04835 [Aggregatilineales bacterium]
MELRLEIPRINDNPSDYDVLFGLWEQLVSDETHQAVVLDFARCDFLRQSGVAFCLGLARLAQSYGKQIAVENLPNGNVAINLRKEDSETVRQAKRRLSGHLQRELPRSH